MMKKLFFALLSISLLACGPKISDEKMQELDLLESRLDSTEQYLSQLDSAETFAAIENYEANLYFIQNELQDTFPRETAFFVDTYYRLRKPLRNYARNYSAVMQELRINRQQLVDLRTDAEAGLIEEQQFDEYLDLERDNVKVVDEASRQVMEKALKAMELYHQKSGRVDSLVKVYKAKQDSL